MTDTLSLTITAYGDERNLATLVQLLKTMDNLGYEGASRVIRVDYDGDGGARLGFTFGDTNVTEVYHLEPTEDGSDMSIVFD